PGYGPKRIASELRREQWGGIVVSHNGVWRCLQRHGLNTRTKRLSLVASYRAPYQPPREAEPERHVEAERPGELVGIDCFYVGRPQTNGAVEALHRLILEECWRPAFARYLHVRFTGLKRDLAHYIDDYNFRRTHNGRLTRGRIPGEIVYGARKVKTR